MVSNSKGPDTAERAEQHNEAKARKAWVDNLEHVQRGFKQLMQRLSNEIAADGEHVSIRAGLRGDPVMVVTDKHTGEVVREIPPAEIRRIADKLEHLKGLFLNQAG